MGKQEDDSKFRHYEHSTDFKIENVLDETDLFNDEFDILRREQKGHKLRSSWNLLN